VEAGRLGGTRLGAGSLRIFSSTVTALIDQHCVGVPVAAAVPEAALALPEARGLHGRQDPGRVSVRPRQQATV
jgi:hypothetical protein